jgi:hypothetical protein
VLVEWVTKTDPEVYSKYVTVDKNGYKVILVERMNAIYTTMVAGLLYYRKFADSLDQKKFTKNPYDPCVWNKTIEGKQCTICFHVNDCKISHVKSSVNDSIIAWLRQEYESIFTDGSGKMKVARGRVHVYVGMTLDVTVDKVVKVTMIPYVDEIIGAWEKAFEDPQDGFKQVRRQRISTAAPEDLFKVDDDASKLSAAMAKDFHSIIAMTLYVTKQARLDTLLAVAFLTTRV